jgi:hypothetical protein
MDISVRRRETGAWTPAVVASNSSRPDTAVPRIDLLLILVLAAVCGAITASATGHFEPLPLFAGVIVAGVVRSLRTARQRG